MGDIIHIISGKSNTHKRLYHTFVWILLIALIISSYLATKWLISFSNSHYTPYVEKADYQSNKAKNNPSIRSNLYDEPMVIGNSKNRKYYYPWCKQVYSIKSGYKVTFSSEDEAKNKGFKGVSNCKAKDKP